MKKIILAICTILAVTLIAACGGNDTEQTGGTPNSNSSSGDYEYQTMWQLAGKGIGKIVPEPNVEYSLNASDSYISAEVENSNYDFFENYVNECIKAGFKGSITAAEIPDYYFMSENEKGDTVKVYFYKDDARCSIYACYAEK